MKQNIFFIIGCPRSGTTALAKFLQQSKNGRITVESEPKLCIEGRDLYDGRLGDPEDVLIKSRSKQIEAANVEGFVYGDKNPNYLPFIPALEKLWKPKYVFIVRDGRDVVRSMMDWHEHSRGRFFDLAEDSHLSTKTKTDDWWDYSRLRPGDEISSAEWIKLSRFEKMAWYWNKFNLLLIQSMKEIGAERTYLIDLSRLNNTWEELAGFLGLVFEDLALAAEVMGQNVNSVKQRFNAENDFPGWENWNKNQSQSFFRQASVMMSYFNYF